jgi:hypothetical protein
MAKADTDSTRKGLFESTQFATPVMATGTGVAWPGTIPLCIQARIEGFHPASPTNPYREAITHRE